MKMIQRVRSKPALRIGLTAFLIALASFLGTYQMQYSVADGFLDFFRLSSVLILLNCLILFWVVLAAKVLLQRWHFALILVGVLTTVWSILNYFILKFHGSPLFFSEFRNFSTAMNVADGYRFSWERRLTWLTLLGLAVIGCGVLIRVLQGKRKFFSWKELAVSAGAWVLLTVLLYLSLFVCKTIKPRKTMLWTWSTGVYQYGYMTAIVEDVDRSTNAFSEPEGYSPEKLQDLKKKPSEPVPEQLPDLIVILNESYYDLGHYTKLTADADYMEGFYGHDNAAYGYAIITSSGGGTNNSEYELLTSKSMHLLSMEAPFNYMDLGADESTAPHYLSRFGYASAAMHCEPASNYSRNRAYPAMGFDSVIMGYENFVTNRYGNRRVLDSDNYQDMIRQYNSMPEGPRLVYLLTFQNHGGYETNPPEQDLVHVAEDFGEYTDDVNEFLSTISLSSKAFGELTEYFAGSDRPVVILMLGDHAPPMTKKLPIQNEVNEAETEIRLRSVPYVIWANYEVEFPEYTDFVTLTDLMPLVFRTAGIPTSFYQDYLLTLHDQIPARTLNGYYMDRDGNYGKVDESCPYYQQIMLAYYLEYNALKGGSHYRSDLFEP